MKISDWLLSHYKKKFGEDLIVLQHDHGPTWNDGGGWNTTIVQCGDKIFRIYMSTDYRSNDLEVTEMKVIMKPTYIPK